MNAPELDIGPPPEKPKHVRVFVAHAKHWDPVRLEDVRDHLTDKLRDAAIRSGKRAVVAAVLGREDFDAHFKRCGSWDAWAADIVARIDYVTRDPYYSAIITPDRVIGKAMSVTIGRALQTGRMCLYFEHTQGTLHPVKDITQVSDNFKAGWEIVT